MAIVKTGTAWLVVLLLATATLGCVVAGTDIVGGGDDGGDHGSGGSSGGNGGSIQFGADGGSSSLLVTAIADSPSICPGQCANLGGQAARGRAPYSYKWDYGLSPDARSITVCPDVTTTYAVTATDSAGHTSGEVQTVAAMGSAKVTVKVSASCSDGAAPAEAGPDDTGPAILVNQTVFAPFTGITVGIIEGSTAYWTAWQTSGMGTAAGVLSPPSGPIQVKYTGEMYGAQTTTGFNYWTPAATYVSSTVAAAPPSPGIIELSGGTTQPNRITFSSHVTNPLVAIVSLGTGPVQTVELTFNAPFTILSSGVGYQGSGLGTGLLTAADGGVNGDEGNGVLQLQGTF